MIFRSGGTLSVTNLAGTLAASDSFKLFTATAYQGAFSSISPATPGSGLAWDLTALTNGVLKVMAGTGTPPLITSVTVSGTNIFMSGTNNTGTGGGTFYVRASTNVALPLIDWTPVATNVFDANGKFNVTNLVNEGPLMFFRIELP